MLPISSFFCRASQFGSLHYLPRGLAITGCKKSSHEELARITQEFEETIQQLEEALAKDPDIIECSEFQPNMELRSITARELSERRANEIKGQLKELSTLAYKIRDSNIRWKMYNTTS